MISELIFKKQFWIVFSNFLFQATYVFYYECYICTSILMKTHVNRKESPPSEHISHSTYWECTYGTCAYQHFIIAIAQNVAVAKIAVHIVFK